MDPAARDALRRAVEEQEPVDQLRVPPRQRLRGVAADIVADDADALEPERGDQRRHVVAMAVRAGVAARGRGFGAVAKAAQVGRDQAELAMQPVHQRQPGHPEFRPAMQQQHGRPIADLGDVQERVAHRNLAMAQSGRGGEVAGHGGVPAQAWRAHRSGRATQTAMNAVQGVGRLLHAGGGL